MKKLATLFVLSLSAFAFAGTTVVKNVDAQKKVQKSKRTIQLCGVSVTFYDSAGNITGYQLYTSDQPNLSSCMSWQNGVIANLRSQGYRVTRTVDVNP